jgi:acyl-CoA synthetase (AMP-forming)/AMP-acid ligase II
MQTFPQRLFQLYNEIPDQETVRLLFSRQPDKVITYRDLLHGSNAYAQELVKAKVEPGDVVILILKHGEELFYSFFGAILHGSIPSIMPFLTEKLAPDKYRQSLTALFEITAPTCVITYPEFREEVENAIKPGSSVRRIITSDTVTPSSDPDFNFLTGVKRNPDDIVLLQHSSGTTGLQKGVALSHQAVFNQLDSYAEALNLTQSDVIVSWLPLYHDMGLIAGFILPILCQVPLVLMSPFDWVRAPTMMIRAVSDHHGTLTWLPNFAYNFFTQKVRDRDLKGIDLSTWRAVINCSEPMYLKSHQMFLERFAPYGLRPDSLNTCYAMAENVFAVTQGGINSSVTIDRIDQRKYLSQRIAQPSTETDSSSITMLSAGQPISNTSVCVMDDQYEILPDRHIGEIALQSNCMLTGYYNRNDLTEKSFHNGWYLTGDLGYLSDGEVYITGRVKDLIIVGGKNVYPQDLENLASEVPGVHPGRVAAFGVFNETVGTEDVVIVAEVDQDNNTGIDEHLNQVTTQQADEIANEIRTRVTRGSDIALRYVKIVDRGWLLKTSSGKVARNANKDKYLNEVTLAEQRG